MIKTKLIRVGTENLGNISITDKMSKLIEANKEQRKDCLCKKTKVGASIHRGKIVTAKKKS